jgi:MFS family permease
VILALVAFVDAVDRGILPGVIEEVQADLGFSDTRIGVLAAAFVVVGIVVSLPAGYLADRGRRTRIIAVVLASWGVVSGMNALAQNFWQFLAVRMTLGVGETIDNPASSSLLADYYAPDRRGRAFALQRLAPIVGTAVGLGLGGLVGSTLGWRWAFLLVGVPGSLLAVAMWRLPEPTRGEHDRADGSEHDAGEAVAASERGPRALVDDVRRALRIPTLRAILVGSAVGSASLQGIGFWASAFYERHTSIGASGADGVVGVVVALGAVGGIWLTGRLVDRRHGGRADAPMTIAGSAHVAGSVLLVVSFLQVPLWVRMPLHLLAVGCVVGGLLALTVMTVRVVPASLRGTAFSLSTFIGSLGAAFSPLAIGAIADRFDIVVDGQVKGDLAKAFLLITPMVTIGGLIVLRGRRHARGDVQAATIA